LLYTKPGALTEGLLLKGLFGVVDEYLGTNGLAGSVIVVGGNSIIAWHCVDEAVNKRLFSRFSRAPIKRYFIRGCVIATPAALFGLTLAAIVTNDLGFALLTGGCNFLVLLFSQTFSYIGLKESGYDTRRHFVHMVQAIKQGLKQYSSQSLSFLERILGLNQASYATQYFRLEESSQTATFEVEEGERVKRPCGCILA